MNRLWTIQKRSQYDKKKLVRTFQSSDIGRSWLSCRRIPVKTRFHEPVQLDLVEYIQQKEQKNG